MSDIHGTADSNRNDSQQTVIELIAAYACSARYEDLDETSVHHAVRYLADTVACALAAAKQKEICNMMNASPRCTDPAVRICPVWGSSQPHMTSPSRAALLYGSMIRCLDSNDLYMPEPPQSIRSVGHCSDAMGGVMALVDPNKNCGRQILLALVVAYEVQAALSTCLNWLDRGFHSVTQINFAVPAAAGVFPQYGLCQQTMAHAIALSATTGMCLQAWLKPVQANDGSKQALGASGATATPSPAPTSSSISSANVASDRITVTSASTSAVPSVKHVSVGLACQRGVECVELAQCGVTANVDAVETMVRFLGDEKEKKIDLKPFSQLGRELHLHRHLIKQYSAQFNLQAVISCALDLYESGVRLSNLASLHVYGHGDLCAGVQGSPESFRPRSQGSADHSTPYVLYAALRDGCFIPSLAYADEAWLSSEALSVMQRVTLTVDPAFESRRMKEGKFGCRIEAKLNDGRTLSSERLVTAGHPSSPLTDAELMAKWQSMLDLMYGDGMAQRLWHACSALKHNTEGQGTEAVQNLFTLLQTSPK